jgi:hypothetical protein
MATTAASDDLQMGSDGDSQGNSRNGPPLDATETRWSLAERIAFRFCFAYFCLFIALTQVLSSLISIPKVDIPDIATLLPVRSVILWTAAHLFRISQQPVYEGSGSGDKIFDWVMVFCSLVAALLATTVWSVLDRRRSHYRGMLKWFKVFLRFALGTQMIGYGCFKLFPLQMSFPGLGQLLEPYGNQSPMGVLWNFIGASPGYEFICGAVEFLSGVLLFLPRTALLGALATAAVAGQIFILNMTYDVPVKLLSFHLILMALFLAAPEFSRIARFFFGSRPVELSTQPALFRTARANRIALAVQMVLALWLIGSNLYATASFWTTVKKNVALPQLYGIWNVERMTIDGHERAPLIGDYGRWRKVIFDSGEYLSFLRMDDSRKGYGCKADVKTQDLALTDRGDKKWTGNLHYTLPLPDRLMLEGKLGAETVSMELKRVDHTKIELVKRGFHWVQEYPYNR